MIEAAEAVVDADLARRAALIARIVTAIEGIDAELSRSRR
jgi:hypothetical protein